VSERTFPSDENAEQQPSPTVRILLVDDYDSWRLWVYSKLSTQQQLQIVGEASDGLEAVSKAHELKPDLILLDIALPNLNGLEVASQIAQSSYDTKIIFLTKEQDADIVKHALSNAAMGYVVKEEAETQLLAAIAAVLQGKRFVSRRLAIESDNCDCEEGCTMAH